MGDAMASPGPRSHAAGMRARRLFLRFDIGTERYALATSDIVRVLPLMPLKRLPAAPVWVAGILLYGSEPVPVIDVSALAAGQVAAVRASTRLALVAYRPTPDAAARHLGLLLEHATDTVHYDIEEFQSYGLDNRDAPYLGPVLADANGMVQCVRIADLLPASVRERLFRDADQTGAAP
jgi:chemotaxis-related protein WspB